MKAALVVSWTGIRTGREAQAVEYGREVDDYWGKLAAEGKCSEPKWFWAMAGPSLWIVEGDYETLLKADVGNGQLRETVPACAPSQTRVGLRTSQGPRLTQPGPPMSRNAYRVLTAALAEVGSPGMGSPTLLRAFFTEGGFRRVPVGQVGYLVSAPHRRGTVRGLTSWWSDGSR